MGKASRLKAERRAAKDGQHEPAPTHRRRIPVFWLAVAALVLASIATLIVTSPDDRDRDAERKARGVPAFAEVSVHGEPLPTWTSNEDDADAQGREVPSLSGTSLGKRTLRFGTTDGVARVYIVVAHWCPHCQDEVPRLVTWSRDNEIPRGVEIVGVSTAVSEDQDNYPPAEWLAREGWTWPVLIDDEIGTAADALGVEGFPFIVFTDDEGRVVRRYSGEMPIDDFDEEVRALAPEAAPRRSSATSR